MNAENMPTLATALAESIALSAVQTRIVDGMAGGRAAERNARNHGRNRALVHVALNAWEVLDKAGIHADKGKFLAACNVVTP